MSVPTSGLLSISRRVMGRVSWKLRNRAGCIDTLVWKYLGGHKVLDGGVPDAHDFRVGSDRKMKRGTRCQP